MEHLRSAFSVSERRACLVVGCSRRRLHYESVKKEDETLRERLKALALKRRRFGYKRLAVLLKREGFRCNVKKVYRMYKEEGLSVKRRKGRKKAVGTRAPLPRADSINQVWSLDFMSDALADGRRFRLFGVMDQGSRECVCLIADTSISGVRVVRELDELIKTRATPRSIVSDNGPELTSKAVQYWAKSHGIDWHYITPGRPMENGYTESLNGKIRDEFLNEHWFKNLAHVRALLAEWKDDYNHVRPHSSLNYQTPEQASVRLRNTWRVATTDARSAAA